MRQSVYIDFIFTYFLTAVVVGAPQITSQPVSSIFSLFSKAFWNFANSSPVHSLMLSSLLFFYLPCLLSPFTVPCKRVLARSDERETCPCFSLHLFNMVRRSSCCPITCWILAHTSSLVTWSLYEKRSLVILLRSSAVRVDDSQEYIGCDRGAHQSYLGTDRNASVVPN